MTETKNDRKFGGLSLQELEEAAALDEGERPVIPSASKDREKVEKPSDVKAAADLKETGRNTRKAGLSIEDIRKAANISDDVPFARENSPAVPAEESAKEDETENLPGKSAAVEMEAAAKVRTEDGIGNSFLYVLGKSIQDRNIGFLLWMTVNCLMYSLIPGGVIFYFLWIVVLSGPVGGWALRRLCGCRTIKKAEDQEKIRPVMERLQQNIRERWPSQMRNISVYLSEDAFPDTFACGKRTICITRGMLDLPGEELEAGMAHEVGHLLKRDSEENLIMAASNPLVLAFLLIISECISLLMPDRLLNNTAMSGSTVRAFRYGLVGTLIFLWMRAGVRCCGLTTLNREGAADRCACELVGPDALEQCLIHRSLDRREAGVWDSFRNSRSAVADRIVWIGGNRRIEA